MMMSRSVSALPGRLGGLQVLAAVAATVLGMNLIAPVAASADMIRYTYGGTITSADPTSGMAVGTPFSGTFSYDPTGPQGGLWTSVSTPEAPIYDLARSLNGANLTAAVGGQSVLGPVDGLNIRVAGPGAFVAPDNPPALITIYNASTLPGGVDHASNSLALDFRNSDHARPSPFALPTSFQLADFTDAQFTLSGPDGKTLGSGAITTLVAGLTPEPTPEPTTLALLVGGGALVLRRTSAHRRPRGRD